MIYVAIVVLLLLEIRYRWHKPLSLEKHAHIDLPTLASHRGYGKKGIFPENTLSAFLASQQQGFLVHELDVRQSLSGDIFLFHGPYLDGQTNGKRRRMEKTCSQEIKRLNFGHYLKNEAQEHVVSLKSYLTTMQNSITNIEIKRDWFDFNISLERKVAKVVNQTNSHNKVFVSAFHFFTLFFNKLYFSKIPNGILFSHKPFCSVYLWLMLRLFLFDSIHAPDSYVHHARVKKWKKKGYNVLVWTVNKKERVQELVDWGVDIVITDNISLMKEMKVNLKIP